MYLLYNAKLLKQRDGIDSSTRFRFQDCEADSVTCLQGTCLGMLLEQFAPRPLKARVPCETPERMNCARNSRSSQSDDGSKDRESLSVHTAALLFLPFHVCHSVNV